MSWFITPEGNITAKLISSVILAVVLFLLRTFLLHKISLQKKEVPADIKRRWIVLVQNTILLVFLLGILYIWLEQLRAITTTVMVIGVAIVLATRDFFLNITGFFFRTGTHFFTIGERIEVDGIRGDVIDQSLLGVTILEVGPGKTNHIYTGKKIFIPNIKFLKSAVTKEAYLKDYVFHFITIPLKSGDDWIHAQEFLLRAAHEVCVSYLDDVKKRTRDIAKKHSLNAPAIDPRIQVQLPEPGRVNLVLRVPLPAKKRGWYEQKILQKYLQITEEMKKLEKNSQSESPATANKETAAKLADQFPG